MPLKPNKLIPILWTTKLQETIEFYTMTLNFECADRNDDWGWAALRNDAIELMVANPPVHSAFDKPLFTGSFYFNINNVEELWSELRDKASVVYPIETFDWGMKEFAIYDNNGYMLQFGQEIESK